MLLGEIKFLEVRRLKTNVSKYWNFNYCFEFDPIWGFIKGVGDVMVPLEMQVAEFIEEIKNVR